MLNPWVILSIFGVFATGENGPWEDLTELTLEELANIEVTSASRAPVHLVDSPQSIFVISGEQLRKAGITHLVEVLHLVPGVHLARNSASQWATGIRGFSDNLSRSILVLFDGRSVYNPLFAGVYWENLEFPVDIIERIEVILGPGGSVWGTNAVNGVINIITKSVSGPQGGSFSALGGSVERVRSTLRYRNKLGKGNYRVWATHLEEDHANYANGEDFDAWEHSKLGFRTDQEIGPLAFNVQAGLYDGELGQQNTSPDPTGRENLTTFGDGTVAGNFLRARSKARWGPFEWQLQLSHQFDERSDLNFHQEQRALNAELALTNENRWGTTTFGGSHRHIRDQTTGTRAIYFRPEDARYRINGLFFEHQSWQFQKRVLVHFGIKAEDHDFTDWEWQPRLGISLVPNERLTLWAAVSRAIRAPARVENAIQSFSLTGNDGAFFALQGNPDFDSEVLDAYEIGSRHAFGRQNLQISLFHYRHDRLLTTELGAPTVADTPYGPRPILPVTIGNGLNASTHGGELRWSFWSERFGQYSANYSYLDLDVSLDPGSTDLSGQNAKGSSPRNQFRIAGNFPMTSRLHAHANLTWVDRLPTNRVEAFWNANIHVQFQLNPEWRFALNGRNLIESDHSEFNPNITHERHVSAEIKWRW